jgi:plastocyanin
VKTRRRSGRRLGATVLALALTAAVAACGGPAGEPPAGNAPTEELPAEVRASAHRVVIRMTDGMRFEPENPVVAVGDTVVWVNEGGMPHTSTDEPGRAGVPEHNRLPAGAATWDSGFVESGELFRRVFDVPGEYAYLCTLHEMAGMVGRLTVR